MDDCGHCPRCGGELRISPRAKILYECSNYECDYKEYLWPNPPKGGKAKGGKKMDAREKWEFLVDCYNKNKNAPEQRIQRDWENLFVEIFGYSKLLKEVDSQRSIQIGSTVRTIPDIIIHNKEQGDLFVVELKQHTLTTGTEQLFSYLKLLKVDLGVLICNKIYLYDYDITKDDDKQAFVEIAFTKDNPDGIKFVELFSKASFDRQHIKNLIQERKKEKENIHAIQQKVTAEFVRQVLQEQLSETYSQEEIQQALEGIVITVDKKVAMPVIPTSVFNVALNKKTANKGTKDNTQYSVDGNITGGKCPTAYAVVSKYISMYPTISYSELYNIFPDEAGKPGFGKCIRLPQDVTEAQWNGNRFNKHPLHLASGEQVVVSTQWTPDNFNSFIQYATKAGIEIKPV